MTSPKDWPNYTAVIVVQRGDSGKSWIVAAHATWGDHWYTLAECPSQAAADMIATLARRRVTKLKVEAKK